MKKILSLIIMCSLCFAFSLKELKKTLTQESIEGDFVQTKNIKNFPMAFKSSGSFIIKDNTLYWKTLKPIQSFIKINSDGIFTQDEKKQWYKSQNKINEDIFLDLLNLNEKKLAQLFNIYLTGTKDDWELKLKPKSFVLKEIFSHILIKGDKAIKSFDINETRGTFSHIDFSKDKTK